MPETPQITWVEAHADVLEHLTDDEKNTLKTINDALKANDSKTNQEQIKEDLGIIGRYLKELQDINQKLQNLGIKNGVAIKIDDGNTTDDNRWITIKNMTHMKKDDGRVVLTKKGQEIRQHKWIIPKGEIQDAFKENLKKKPENKNLFVAESKESLDMKGSAEFEPNHASMVDAEGNPTAKALEIQANMQTIKENMEGISWPVTIALAAWVDQNKSTPQTEDTKKANKGGERYQAVEGFQEGLPDNVKAKIQKDLKKDKRFTFNEDGTIIPNNIDGNKFDQERFKNETQLLYNRAMSMLNEIIKNKDEKRDIIIDLEGSKFQIGTLPGSTDDKAPDRFNKMITTIPSKPTRTPTIQDQPEENMSEKMREDRHAFKNNMIAYGCTFLPPKPWEIPNSQRFDKMLDDSVFIQKIANHLQYQQSYHKDIIHPFKIRHSQSITPNSKEYNELTNLKKKLSEKLQKSWVDTDKMIIIEAAPKPGSGPNPIPADKQIVRFDMDAYGDMPVNHVWDLHGETQTETTTNGKTKTRDETWTAWMKQDENGRTVQWQKVTTATK